MVDSFSTTRSCPTPPKIIAPSRPLPKADDSMNFSAGAVIHTAVAGSRAVAIGKLAANTVMRRTI